MCIDIRFVSYLHRLTAGLNESTVTCVRHRTIQLAIDRSDTRFHAAVQNYFSTQLLHSTRLYHSRIVDSTAQQTGLPACF